jgi:adenosylcobinamide-GDP ribazoletransferase
MRAVEALRGAVAFLTRIPVGSGAVEAEDVARGAALFPLVGAGIGAATGGVAVALHPRLPALVAAALALAVELLLTGALHLDGLADTADSLGSRSREGALEVMRDPRIGVFGAAAVVLALLVKAAVIAGLLARGGTLVSLVAAGALGRAAILPLAASLPYARTEGGLSERIGPVSALLGAAIAAAFAVGLAEAIGAGMLAAAAGTTVALGVAYRRRFGGVTGDTLGATAEVAGTAALIVSLALRP